MKENVDLLIYNIKELITPYNSNLKRGEELKELKIINNGGIAIKNGKILCVSDTEEVLDRFEGEKVLDLKNENILLPGFVDPHTHILFGGSREDEFLARINGESYLSIQKKGGGIYKTQKDTISLNEDELVKITKERILTANSYGILTLEIKSGYGLFLQEEIKLLKTIKKIKEESKIKTVSTFLLHLIPKEFDRKVFLSEVLEIMPKIYKEDLFDFIDIFIEEGAFSVEEATQILEVTKNLGASVSLHIDQFNNLKASKLAKKYKIKSLSHLDLTEESELEELSKGDTVGIIFPLERFIFKRDERRGRKLIDLGIPLSISTDFNPGTSPSLNFPLILSLSIIREGLTVEEAINSSTINGAYALNLQNEVGSIEVGKRADFVVFSLKSFKEIPYYVGMNFIKYVIINGEVINIDR
ncbi:MAG: imidazolonepropionase [Caldisericia bacterium]|jgi:imidazolonepropionase|nr:imidazolonepropionase [Caldisericia bacterium]